MRALPVFDGDDSLERSAVAGYTKDAAWTMAEEDRVIGRPARAVRRRDRA